MDSRAGTGGSNSEASGRLWHFMEYWPLTERGWALTPEDVVIPNMCAAKIGAMEAHVAPNPLAVDMAPCGLRPSPGAATRPTAGQLFKLGRQSRPPR